MKLELNRLKIPVFVLSIVLMQWSLSPAQELQISDDNESEDILFSDEENIHNDIIETEGVSSDDDVLDDEVNSEQTMEPSKNYHVVVEGDTLWDISGSYLTDPFRWPEIWNLNRSIVKDPHWIFPGQKMVLLLPPLESVSPVSVQVPIEEVYEEEVFESEPVVQNNEEPRSQIGVRYEVGRKFKGVGNIHSSMEGKALLEPGDDVILRFKSRKKYASGSQLIVYRDIEYLLDTEGIRIREGQKVIETIAVIELTKRLNPWRASGKILKVTTAVEIGDSIKVPQ